MSHIHGSRGLAGGRGPLLFAIHFPYTRSRSKQRVPGAVNMDWGSSTDAGEIIFFLFLLALILFIFPD